MKPRILYEKTNMKLIIEYILVHLIHIISDIIDIRYNVQGDSE